MVPCFSGSENLSATSAHMTNACCLLLSGCSTHHPSLRHRTLQQGRIFGNSRGRPCNLAMGSNILHWAQVITGFQVAGVLKNISALTSQGFSQQLYPRCCIPEGVTGEKLDKLQKSGMPQPSLVFLGNSEQWLF